MKPVTEPAKTPAKKAIRLATSGFTPVNIRAAAVEAPNVKEPSAVISGNSKTLKLMKIPNASKARIRPIVNDPINSDMT